MLNFDSMRLTAAHRQAALEREDQKAASQTRFRGRLSLLAVLPVCVDISYLIGTGRIRGQLTTTEDWLMVGTIMLAFVGMTLQRRSEERLEALSQRRQTIERASVDLAQLERIIDEQAPFALYLRDFRTGRSREESRPVMGAGLTGIASPTTWPREFGSATTSAVISAIAAYMPVVLLHGGSEKTPIVGGLMVYSDDTSWERDFQFLADRATFVVGDFRFGSSATAGVQFELDFLRNGHARKTILLGQASDISAVQSYCPEMADAALTCFLPDYLRTDSLKSLQELRHFLLEKVGPPV